MERKILGSSVINKLETMWWESRGLLYYHSICRENGEGVELKIRVSQDSGCPRCRFKLLVFWVQLGGAQSVLRI
jgi:hypothetical protein